MLLHLLVFGALATAARGLVGAPHQQLFLYIDDCEQYNTTAVGAGPAAEAAAAEYGAPVCGSDGATYANGRLLRCLNARRTRHEREGAAAARRPLRRQRRGRRRGRWRGRRRTSRPPLPLPPALRSRVRLGQRHLRQRRRPGVSRGAARHGSNGALSRNVSLPGPVRPGTGEDGHSGSGVRQQRSHLRQRRPSTLPEEVPERAGRAARRRVLRGGGAAGRHVPASGVHPGARAPRVAASVRPRQRHLPQPLRHALLPPGRARGARGPLRIGGRRALRSSGDRPPGRRRRPGNAQLRLRRRHVRQRAASDLRSAHQQTPVRAARGRVRAGGRSVRHAAAAGGHGRARLRLRRTQLRHGGGAALRGAHARPGPQVRARRAVPAHARPELRAAVARRRLGRVDALRSG